MASAPAASPLLAGICPEARAVMASSQLIQAMGCRRGCWRLCW
ncbi:MAG TPA: hypothetical protein VGA04_10030 [Streptosporangiaceae bacterium]